MIRIRVVKQVTLLTMREFIRTPAALFWTYGFPLLMAVTLGFAFRESNPEPLPVAIVESDVSAAQFERLKRNPRLAPEVLSAQDAEQGFRYARFLLLVSVSTDRPGVPTLRFDAARPRSELTRLHVERSLLADEPPEFHAVSQGPPGSRYIDWLIPGLLSLNLLGAGLWGVGFNMVQMRVKNILRRLIVTPMHKSEFLVAFLLSRLAFVIPEGLMLLGFAWLVFDVPISGSMTLIVLLIVLGGISFIGLGMLLASRAQTSETVSGLMNLCVLPMWMLGGSFFDSSRFPDLVQPLVKALPITHLNVAMREVVNHGKGFVEILPEIGFLAVFGAVSLGIAIRCFRWT